MGNNNISYGTPFDDVFRTLLEKCSKLIIPVINEVFGTDYSMEEDVTLLSDVHFVLDEDGEDRKRITDSCIQIRRKMYHIECESNPDSSIAIRMIEYDFHIALSQAECGTYEYVLTFPESAVLMLRHTKSTPDRLNIKIVLPDKSEAMYSIPTVKVQNYTKEELFDRDLLFFIPYYILKFEKELDEINKEEEKLQWLRSEYGDIYERLCKLDLHKKVGPNYLYDLIKLTTKLTEYVARDAENVKKEVIIMGGQVIDTGSDAILEKGISMGISMGISQGISQSIVELLQNKGEVNEELREMISIETDGNTLRRWLQLSAKVSSVAEFINQMN